MAQYVSFSPTAEVLAVNLYGILQYKEEGEAERRQLLRQHGINPDWIFTDRWILVQQLLNAYRTLAEQEGEEVLYTIGCQVPTPLQFPQPVNGLRSGLLSVDFMYHINHRGGEIGNYLLDHFDQDARLAVMTCHTPYPSYLDHGIVTGFVKRYMPTDRAYFSVELDESRPTRRTGADRCTFRITW